MITHDNAEQILESSNSNFFLIYFIAPNGNHYSWRPNGFSLASFNTANGFLDMSAVRRQDAIRQFSSALINA